MTIKAPPKAPDYNTLIGCAYHAFAADGTVDKQGVILGQPQPGYYLVSQFEWLLGTESCPRHLVPFTEMLGWNIYDNTEDMGEEWQRSLKYRKPR